jgi:hypothetical protein
VVFGGTKRWWCYYWLRISGDVSEPESRFFFVFMCLPWTHYSYILLVIKSYSKYCKRCVLYFFRLAKMWYVCS